MHFFAFFTFFRHWEVESTYSVIILKICVPFCLSVCLYICLTESFWKCRRTRLRSNDLVWFSRCILSFWSQSLHGVETKLCEHNILVATATGSLANIIRTRPTWVASLIRSDAKLQKARGPYFQNWCVFVACKQQSWFSTLLRSSSSQPVSSLVHPSVSLSGGLSLCNKTIQLKHSLS